MDFSIKSLWLKQTIIKGSVQFIFVGWDSSEISEVIDHQNSLFVPSRFDFSWKCEWNLVILFIAWLHVYTQNAVIWLAGFWNLDHLYISV